MESRHKGLIKRKAIIFALIIGVLLSTVFFVFAFYEVNRINQEEKIEATERFAVFDNQLNTLINTNINLLKGFVAYILTNENIEDENAYKFLDALLKDQMDYINNVGILYDTVIVWNYPKEPNVASLGVDLAKNESQKKYVLAVKENRQAIFQGPVDLVQGGRGFIVRYPIVEADGQYWGQVSIVLKKEAFIQVIQSFENELHIESIILSEGSIVHGNKDIIKDNLHWFAFDDNVFVWEVGIKLTDLSANAHVRPILLFLLAGVVFFAVTSAVFISIKANEVIKHESLHDQLTGLRNRNSLGETMVQVFAAADRNTHSVGIMLMDLNKFKEINDTYGHAVGDEVLKETATRLKQVARSDEMLFRIGGDEFLLIVPVVKDSSVMDIIKNRIKESLTYRLNVHGNAILVTASIGYSLYKDDATDFDTLFQISDHRMYAEKHNLEEVRSHE